MHLRVGKVLDLGEFCVSSTRADRSADVCYPDEGQRASFKRSVGRQINRQLEVHLHSWYQDTRWLLYYFLPDCKVFPPNVADVQTRFSKRLRKQNILYKNNRVLQVLVVRELFHITEQRSYPMIRGIFRCESPTDQFCNMPSWLLAKWLSLFTFVVHESHPHSSRHPQTHLNRLSSIWSYHKRLFLYLSLL